MAIIGSETSAGGDTLSYISLLNEEIVRPLSFGSTWRRLRLGIIFALDLQGVSYASNTLLGTGNQTSPVMWFRYGLCSGTTHPVGDAATANFLGVDHGSGANRTTTPYTWNPYEVLKQSNLFYASPGGDFGSNYASALMVKQGSVFVNQAAPYAQGQSLSGSGYISTVNSPSNAYNGHSLSIIDFERDTPTTTVGSVTVQVMLANTSLTYGQTKEVANNADVFFSLVDEYFEVFPPSTLEYIPSNFFGSTVTVAQSAINESANGFLDSVNIEFVNHGGTTDPMRIYGIYAKRLF